MPKLRAFKHAYIPFEDDDDELAFERAHVELIKELWAEGYCISCMGEIVGRDPDMVAVLLIDLARNGAVERREEGFMASCRHRCPGYDKTENEEWGA